MRFKFTDGTLIDTRKISRVIICERPVYKWWYFEFMINDYEIPYYTNKFYVRRAFYKLKCDSPFFFKLDHDELYFMILFFCSKKPKMMPGMDLLVILFYTDLNSLLH